MSDTYKLAGDLLALVRYPGLRELSICEESSEEWTATASIGDRDEYFDGRGDSPEEACADLLSEMREFDR